MDLEEFDNLNTRIGFDTSFEPFDFTGNLIIFEDEEQECGYGVPVTPDTNAKELKQDIQNEFEIRLTQKEILLIDKFVKNINTDFRRTLPKAKNMTYKDFLDSDFSARDLM